MRLQSALVALLALGLLALAGCPRRGAGAGGSGSAPSAAILNAEQLAGLIEEARTALDAGDRDKTLELLERVAAYAPDDPDMRALRGRALLASEQFAKAAEDLEVAAATESSDPDLRLSLAEAWDRANRPDRAEPHLRAAAEQMADDAYAWYADGLLLEELGKAQRAAEPFGKADGLDPGNPEFLLAYARTLLACGQLEKARDNAWAAIEVAAGEERTESAAGESQPSGEALEYVARAYEVLARAELAEARKADSDSARAIAREMAHSYIGKIADAVASKALARYHQARAWREGGEPEAALAALDGAEPPREVGWAWAERARIRVALGKDCDKAAQDAARAVELDGPSATLLNLQGWALFKGKDAQGAAKALEAALGIARTDRERGEISYRLFRACESLGDSANAKKYREAAKKFGFQEPK